jgi:gluconolactonase
MSREEYTEVIVIDRVKAAANIEYYQQLGNEPSFRIYDPRFQQLIGSTAKIVLVEERDTQFAHEAGVYNKFTDAVYFTSNFQTSDPIELYSVKTDSFQVSQHHFDKVIQANGACWYNQGVLYCSQGDKKNPSELTWVDPVSGESRTIINNFYGRKFASVNDVVIHHETGDVWFTDPSYGYHQAFRPYPDLPPQVYRFDPQTGEICTVADQFLMCNGLCFSSDYTKMYVTDTGSHQAHEGPGDGHQIRPDTLLPATIYEYDVIDKKRLANRRTFAFADCGVPDGIKCDEHGNVYSGCGDGVHVWSPDGVLLGKIYVGSTVANFCFAKNQIWMFAENKLIMCEIGAKGALVQIECM